ncbi:HARB1-like protein [Mya arenaria]|uniref:Putative nuclease HARBI1 n=1 Tax=Mya arenaria TaxID=6604 RepID=A0ABY7DI48_MYAAR|nr:HARB1-like protein [Mya arenaria]
MKTKYASVISLERDDQMSVKRGFYRKCKFPNIVGAVDGTLVPILAPTADEESFVCRKGFHAINCQAVASSDLRFIDIVAKWPGSSHDAGVFDNSVLKDYLEADLEAVLLGDSGYPLRRYLITPILHPSNENEERCLHRSGGVLPFSPGKSCRVFLACCKLHNLCIDNNMPLPDAIVCADDQGIQQNQEATRPGLTTRAQTLFFSASEELGPCLEVKKVLCFVCPVASSSNSRDDQFCFLSDIVKFYAEVRLSNLTDGA